MGWTAQDGDEAFEASNTLNRQQFSVTIGCLPCEEHLTAHGRLQRRA
jgi:hypothetical protein